MIEPEIAFADLAEDARVAEQFLKFLFKTVLEERDDDLAFITERVEKTTISKLEGFINSPFRTDRVHRCHQAVGKVGEKV